MLKFFYAPEPIRISNHKHLPTIEFKGSKQFRKGKAIPFTHVYITSTSQLNRFARLIKKRGNRSGFVLLSQSASEWILSYKKCPVNLSFQERGIERAISETGLEPANGLKVIIINGMGTAYGDNITGLGALQHFHKFLTRKFGRVQIDLALRNQTVQRTIHSRYDVVNGFIQLPITVSQFYEYDAYIDMSDIILNPDFDNYSMMDYCLRALSMHKQITEDKDKMTSLNVPQANVAAMRKKIIGRANSKESSQKIVMFHPKASSPLRTMPDSEVDRLLQELVAHTNMLFVHCVPVNFRHERVIDMSDLSSGFNQLADIIASCDAVITVGTVIYHVSGNLDIPTFLIPSVEADVRSAAHLPSVTNIVPEQALVHLSAKHKSVEVKDLQRANGIWQSIQGKEVAIRLNKLFAN